MADRSMRWLGLLSALLLPALGLLPDAALGERGPRGVAAQGVAQDEDPNNARVIVKYRAGSALALAAARAGRAQQAGKMAERLALPLLDGRPLGLQVQGLRGRGVSSRQLAARLQAQPDVEWAVVDQRRTITGVLPNDPYYGAGQASITPTVGQWYLRPPDSTAVSAINAEGAWALSTGSPTITVAVIDTGVRFDHPDLLPAAQGGKLWPGYDFVSRPERSNDGDGRDADASDPGDWTTDGECGSGKLATDSSWHGTQVAGLIGAATDNGLGMASVGRNVMVLPVRALGRCGGFDTDIIAAMRWAAGLGVDPVANPHPAQVINLSLGGVVRASCSQAYKDVIAQLAVARVTVVVAAGNYGQNTDGTPQIDRQPVTDPANCPGVIAVSAVRHSGSKVGFSSFGPEVSLAAPGGNCVNTANGTPCLYPLLTTINLGTTAPGANAYSDSFNTSLGTSFAAPLVSGAAALMLSVNPLLTPAQIKAALQISARQFPVAGGATSSVSSCPIPGTMDVSECYCTTSTCGAGMLDAGAAVAQVYAGTLLPTALISASSIAPTAGTVVTLDGRGSSASTGRSIAGYLWAISSGAGLASFTGATNGSTATLATSGAGTVVVSLTVTDSAGAARSAQVTLTVAEVPVVVVTPPAGGGGGGGAMGAGWLLGLATAVGLLGRRRAAS